MSVSGLNVEASLWCAYRQTLPVVGDNWALKHLTTKRSLRDIHFLRAKGRDSGTLCNGGASGDELTEFFMQAWQDRVVRECSN